MRCFVAFLCFQEAWFMSSSTWITHSNRILFLTLVRSLTVWDREQFEKENSWGQQQVGGPEVNQQLNLYSLSFSLTHTHTHTHTRFTILVGTSIGVMVFLLYRPYILLTYTNPTPKPSPHRRLFAFLDFQTTSFCVIYKLVYPWGPQFRSPPLQKSPWGCVYSGLSPHRYIQTKTHTHTHTPLIPALFLQAYTDKYL